MKRKFNVVWTMFLSLCLVMAFTVPTMAAGGSSGYGSGAGYASSDVSGCIADGNVVTHPETIKAYRQKVSLDLSKSNLNITLTASEKSELKKSAKNELSKNMKQVKKFLIDEGMMKDDGTRAGEVPGYAERLDVLKSFGMGRANGNIAKANELYAIGMFYCEGLEDEWTAAEYKAREADYVKNFVAEKFNALQSKALAKKLKKTLQAEFNYKVVALADDGSENAEYGIDGETVVRGKFPSGRSSVPFSTVRFDGDDQVYDEILDYVMSNMYGKYGAVKEGGNSDSSFAKMGKKFDLCMDKEALQTFPESHLFLWSDGILTSSDDSQNSVAYKPDDKRWPGLHCLLEVCDELGTYAVTDPFWAYSNVFNLRLNPAVKYSFAMNGDRDVISVDKVDGKGKIKAVSKPLFRQDDMIRLLKNIPNYDGQVWRYKLVQEPANPANVGGNKVAADKEVKILDVCAESYMMTAPPRWSEMLSVQIFDNVEDAEDFYENNDGDMVVGSATFHNKLTKSNDAAKKTPAKVKIKKAKKGKGKITVSWKRLAKNTTGYEIRVTNKKTKKVIKTVNVKQSKKKVIKKVVKKLKKGKYTVKVRACNKVGGETYKGAWSKAKTVKVK